MHTIWIIRRCESIIKILLLPPSFGLEGPNSNVRCPPGLIDKGIYELPSKRRIFRLKSSITAITCSEARDSNNGMLAWAISVLMLIGRCIVRRIIFYREEPFKITDPIEAN